MRYRGENLIENSVNEECRRWDLEDIAGDSLRVKTEVKVQQTNLNHMPHTSPCISRKDRSHYLNKPVHQRY
jgi:hypothetical protein